MDPALVALGREALLVTLAISAPPLAVALAVGLAAGLLQAATQVQEATAAVVLRLAAVLGTLALAGPWMGAQVVRFARACLALAEQLPPGALR